MSYGDTAAERLRREFDEAFARPPRDAVTLEDVLSIRIGGSRYVVRASELAAVVEIDVVAPLPSRQPHLLGIAGIRGGISAVFSLAGILGIATGERERNGLLCRGNESAVLAFSALDGLLRVPPDFVRALGPEDVSQAFVCGALVLDSESVEILSLERIVRRLERMAASEPSQGMG